VRGRTWVAGARRKTRLRRHRRKWRRRGNEQEEEQVEPHQRRRRKRRSWRGESPWRGWAAASVAGGGKVTGEQEDGARAARVGVVGPTVRGRVVAWAAGRGWVGRCRRLVYLASCINILFFQKYLSNLKKTKLCTRLNLNRRQVLRATNTKTDIIKKIMIFVAPTLSHSYQKKFALSSCAGKELVGC
jgi:hypothetical protein